jgi:two-component system, NtrC family, sensor kinase
MKNQMAAGADQTDIAELKRQLETRTAELEEARAEQEAAGSILSVINKSGGNLSRVFESILEHAHRLCGAPCGSLQLYEGDRVVPVAIRGMTPGFAEFLRRGYPITEGIRPILTAEQPLHLIDLKEAMRSEPSESSLRAAVEIGGIRTMLTVPLLRDGRAFGRIVLARQEVRPFSDTQVALLRHFADQAVLAMENARLFNEVQAKTRDLQESLQQQTATADVLKVISGSAFDLQPVFTTIVQTASRLCEAEFALIYELRGDRYQIVSANNAAEAFVKHAADNPLPLGPGSLVGRTALARKPVHIPDCLADHEYSALDYQAAGHYRTMLGVPLLRDGVAIGVIGMMRTDVRPFTEKQIELVTTFADQAVIAIQNARLFDEVQAKTRDLEEALRYQTGSGDILNVIASSPTDVKPVLKAIVESACELCGAYDALVRLKDGGGLAFGAHHGPLPVSLDPVPITGNSTAGAAVIGRKPVHVHDLLSTEGDSFPQARDLARLHGERTILSVPLLRENESVGAIVLRRSEVHPFSEKQIALLQTFADQAVIAIQNVKLFDEVQAKTRDLEEALRYQTGSANILNVIASSPTAVEPVLKAIVESACELCEAYDAVVILKDGDELQMSAHHGPIPMNRQRWVSDRTSASGRAMADRRPVHVHDVLSDEGLEFPMARGMSLVDGCRTLLSAPLLREGEPIGAIALRRAEMHPFSDKQIALLQTFADQAVIALGNVRLFDEVQARTRELSQSLDNLRTAQDRLIQTEKLASLGQLTAGIAHEIKNPLNFVNNFSALSMELTDELNEVLKQHAFADKIRGEVAELTGLLKDNLGKVVQHGKRADSIVKNMLLHSREGSGEYRPADVNALVDESLNLAYHGARAEKPQFNVTLMRNFDPDAGTIEVFPQEITRVLLNLISNGFYAVTKRKAENGAADFEPLVTATTRGSADRVEIRVRDNGTGIPLHVQEKMFEPFFTTKPAGEGTGLGLSMSHDIIVKQHGGTIEVTTEPGEFAEFTIVLPRTRNHSNKTRG